jgi:transposase InsO family protein
LPQFELSGSDHAEFVICDHTIDITYLHLKAEFVYSAVILDVYTRSLRGWYLSRNLDPDLTLTALKRALAHRTPESHPSDQGVQYAATAYTDLLQAAVCRSAWPRWAKRPRTDMPSG